MKKKLLILTLCLSLGLSVTGCGKTYDEAVQEQTEDDVKYCMGDYFVIETEWCDNDGTYKIVHAKDTGVKYILALSGHRCGITALYNADGTLQVYEDTKSNE